MELETGSCGSWADKPATSQRPMLGAALHDKRRRRRFAGTIKGKWEQVLVHRLSEAKASCSRKGSVPSARTGLTARTGSSEEAWIGGGWMPGGWSHGLGSRGKIQCSLAHHLHLTSPQPQPQLESLSSTSISPSNAVHCMGCVARLWAVHGPSLMGGAPCVVPVPVPRARAPQGHSPQPVGIARTGESPGTDQGQGQRISLGVCNLVSLSVVCMTDMRMCVAANNFAFPDVITPGFGSFSKEFRLFLVHPLHCGHGLGGVRFARHDETGTLRET